MDENEAPSATQIAVLTEQLKNAINDLREVKGQMTQMNTALLELISLRKDVAEVSRSMEGRTKRLFEITDSYGDRIREIETNAAVNRKAWQVVGAIASALMLGSGGLVAWLYNRVENTNHMQYQIETLMTWAARTPGIPPLEVPEKKGK
jgi:hypothetical protein